MKYNELILRQNKVKKRVGRGISAGGGKTAGRGTKGQGARKSSGVRPGFEGGQMPLYMRVPKLRGFKSKRAKAEIVYTEQLESIKNTLIDNEILFREGIVSSPNTNVKLIVKGKLQAKKSIKIQAASAPAIAMVEKAGGNFIKNARQGQITKKNSR